MRTSKSTYSLLLLLTLASVVFRGLIDVSFAHDASSTTPVYKSTISKEEGVVIPFTYDPLLCPMPVAMVRVNGSEPMPFVIDTGFSGPVILETWVVEKLHLKYRQGVIKLSPRIDRPYKCVEITQLDFLDADSYDGFGIITNTAIVDDDNTNARLHGKNLGIAGTIGAPLLKEFVVQFDYQAHEMRMLKADEYILPEATSIHIVPIQDRSGKEWHISVPTTNKQSIDFHIDTGSSITCLNEKVLASLDKKTILFTDKTQLANAAGVQDTGGILVESLKIAGFPIHNIYAAIQSEDEDCLLGNDILSLFLVTFDFPHRRAVFEPYSAISKSNKNDRNLMVQEAAEPFAEVDMAPDGTFTVVAVTDVYRQRHLKGSRIAVGDTVHSVDGIPLHGLSLLTAQDLLRGWANANSKIVLQRNEEWIVVDYLHEGYYGLLHGGYASTVMTQDGTAVVKYKDGTQRVENYVVPSIENVVPPPHVPQVGYDWIWYPNPNGTEYWTAVPASVIQSLSPPPGAPESGHYWAWLLNPHPESGESGVWVMMPNDYVPAGVSPQIISAPPHVPIPGYEWIWYSGSKWTGIWALVPIAVPGHLPVLGPAPEHMRLEIV